jgi:hypothetical protein
MKMIFVHNKNESGKTNEIDRKEQGNEKNDVDHGFYNNF